MDAVTLDYVQDRYKSRRSRKQFMQALEFCDEFYDRGDVNHTNVKQIKRNADTVEVMGLLSHDNARQKSHHWDEDFNKIRQVPDPRMPMEDQYNYFGLHQARLECSRGLKEKRDYDFRNREGKDDWTEQPWSAYDGRYDYTEPDVRPPLRRRHHQEQA